MRLTVETGPLAGTVVTLDRENPAYLGSDPDCAVRVQEAGVQPHQAVVKALRGEGFGLKSLAPGVRVNGAAVEAAPLADGDVIEIGTTRIAFGELQEKGLPTIPGYRIQAELGRGGMGKVYRAEQTSLHRQVALKVLRKSLTSDPQFVAKFVAEARAAAKLQHPNVVAVFDVEHDGDTYFYAMELMQGSLEDELRQRGALPVDRALRVIADAAAGLAYAESLGIVHRDIKPDNLMLDQHGVVKIADLGLAGTDVAAEEKAIGTPHFMAPEQVLKREIDHRTDLYALGCTFYRLVTGRTPFRGQTVKDILRAQVKDDPEPAHKVNADVPADVAAIIARLMAKEPKDRFQTANDLIEELELLLQPPAKKGLWIGLAAAGVLVAGGAVYWAVTKPTEVVEVTRKYDDPEKQQFADEIVRLKQEAREDKATIALLTARTSHTDDTALAGALDEVARGHVGTKAAGEAEQRAEQLRTQVRERERAAAARRREADAHLAAVRSSVEKAIASGNFRGAAQQCEAPPPTAVADEPSLRPALAALRTEVVAAARQKLTALRDAVQTGLAGQDLEAAIAANKALAEALAARARWPEDLADDLTAFQQVLSRGEAAAIDLERTQRAERWALYERMFTEEDGLAPALDRLDFGSAAASIYSFLAGAPDDAVTARARSFQAALRAAERFAAAFRAQLAAGPIPFHASEDEAEQLTGWDVASGRFTVVDPSKRNNKERSVAVALVGPETWRSLVEAVPSPGPGTRECFLGLALLETHRRAAVAFLSRLDPRTDQSGTAGDAYPLGSGQFEGQLRNLPESQEPAVVCLRDELAAGARLVAGLRALSERRHLAAANHLEKLLAEHPHSYLVLALP